MSELLTEELTIAGRESRKLETYDPYLGNILDAVRCYDNASKDCSFLVFPTGETNCNLSFFSLPQPSSHGMSQPLKLETQRGLPILQVVSSTNSVLKASYLAVRDYGGISLCQVQLSSSRITPNIHLTNAVYLSHSQVGNRPIMDVKFASSVPSVLLINDSGSIYQCDVDGGKSTMQTLFQACADAADTPVDPFRRIAPGELNSTCFCLDGKYAKRLDLRSGKGLTDLFVLEDSRNYLTSIEAPGSDHVIRLASTSDVLWIDERFDKMPLLAHKHHRQFERSLQVQTIMLDTPLTCLTSRKNGLVTVYDVSRSSNSLIHVNGTPHSLPSVNGRLSGSACFHSPTGSIDANTSLFHLLDDGSLHCLDLFWGSNTQPMAAVENSALIDMKSRTPQMLRPYAGDGPSSARQRTEVDLSVAYTRLFCSNDEKIATREVDDILERMPVFLQENDGTIENMLTTYDIAVRSREEASDYTRADFFGPNPLGSLNNSDAAPTSLIPTKSMKDQASWHHSISPTLKYLHPAGAFSENLLQQDRTNPNESTGIRESRSLHQLILDLELSTDIFAPQAFPKENNIGVKAFGKNSDPAAISRVNYPPPITFGYLRPKLDTALVENQDSLDLDPLLGARLLLSEWDVGANPEHYQYQDPYADMSEDENTSSRQTGPRATGFQGEMTVPAVPHLQRPPLVVALNSLPEPKVGNRINTSVRRGGQVQLKSGSQPAGFSQVEVTDAAHDLPPQLVANSQVVPGPFGDRTKTARKVAKKRVMGF